ncbi:MAG: hypothetical protein ACRCW1_00425 [Anaerotignaceae bacterium]
MDKKMDKQMDKRMDKKTDSTSTSSKMNGTSEKGMNRTEFAQEYNLNMDKQTKSGSASKTDKNNCR